MVEIHQIYTESNPENMKKRKLGKHDKLRITGEGKGQEGQCIIRVVI